MRDKVLPHRVHKLQKEITLAAINPRMNQTATLNNRNKTLKTLLRLRQMMQYTNTVTQIKSIIPERQMINVSLNNMNTAKLPRVAVSNINSTTQINTNNLSTILRRKINMP